MRNPLQYGDGLFETVRYEGRAFLLDAHLSRFARSAHALDFSAPAVRAGLEAIEALATAGEDGLWRVTIARSADPSGEKAPDVWVERRDLPSRHRPHLVDVVNWSPEVAYAEHKSTSYLASVETRREAMRRGADDGIRVSRAGRVGEASMANVFVVDSDGRVVTPPLEGVLPGTRRAYLLDEAKRAGLEILEHAVDLGTLAHAREIILTSAGVHAIAAASWNGRALDQQIAVCFEEWLCDAR